MSFITFPFNTDFTSSWVKFRLRGLESGNEDEFDAEDVTDDVDEHEDEAEEVADDIEWIDEVGLGACLVVNRFPIPGPFTGVCGRTK